MEILRKNPAFAAVALLLLTLGFGLLGAMLIVDKGAFLDQPPYKDPARLVTLTGTFDDEGNVQDWGISHIDFLDWRQQNQVFQQMAAFSPGGLDFNLVAGDQTERVSGELVSYNFFSLLGATPALGRAFTAEEDGKPFEHPVAVLGYDLWQRRFGGDRGVVGKSADLNGQKYTVIGVAPRGFHGLSGKADAWIPSSMPPAPIYVANRRMRWLGGVASLKPGVTLEAAQRDMDRVTTALAAQHPESNKGMGVRLTPIQQAWSAGLQPDLRLLTLGAVLLLLFACVDVALLLRRRAGAPDGTAEGTAGAGLVLSLAGAALGLALASWAVSKLIPASGLDYPGFVRLSAGPGVIAAVLLLAVVCGLLIGVAGRGTGTSSGWRLVQGVTAVVTIVLAVTLSAGAGLMAKGYRQGVSRDHLGFDPRNLLILRVDLQGPKYKEDAQVIAVVRAYLDRVAKVPGVKSFAIGGPTIPTDAWVGAYITIEDHNSSTPAGTYPIMTHAVSPDYFRVLGVRLLQGRAFTLADSPPPGSPFPVIVSREMAAQQWPKKSPLGQRIKFSTRDTQGHPWLPVVGVVDEVQHEGLLVGKRPAPDIYLPILTSPIRIPTTLNFLVRPQAGVSTASLVPALEREIHAVTPDTPTFDAATLEERLAKQTQKGRFQVGLAALLAGLALLLAIAAAYGAAAGARGAALLAVLGVALGLGGAFALGRRLADLLYGVSPGDPLILGGTAVLVFVLVLAAGVLARGRGSADGISRPDRPALRGRAAL
jgi:putative ABC transport system permease protein